MASVADKDLWPFLSIVAWPDGWDLERVAQLLARPRGLDLPTLRMRLGQDPPMVLERVEPPAAAAMIEALLGAGGDGFTFTLDDLAGGGPTLEVADMSVAEGALDVELAGGLTTRLPFANVAVVVRARVSETVKVRGEPPTRRQLGIHGRHRTRTWDAIKAEIESAILKTDTRAVEKLELHAADRTVYGIGDRFRFGVLGDLRGYADKANMDSLAELLDHLCPDAVIDTYYRLWRPPPGADRLRLPGPRLGEAETRFAFYSRWAAMTYRHVMQR